MMSRKKYSTVRSSIKTELMRLALKKGGWIAASGAIIIILGGTLLPLPYLKIWGIPLFFSGLLLIALGWLPYRKLQRLEMNPHQLQYNGESLLFLERGKPLFKISEKSIARMDYVEKELVYGIAIWLKKPVEEKIKVLQPRFDFETFASNSANRFQGCDLFLPFFTQSSTQQIKDLLELDHAS